MSAVRTPSRRLSSTTTCDAAAETPEARLVQLGPAARARGEGQQPDALAAIAEREDEQPGPSVLARARVAHHRAVAVVDLALFPRRRDDDRVRLGRLRPPEAAHEATHHGVLGREAVVVARIPSDRDGDASPGNGELDQVSVRLARTGGGGPPGAGGAPWSGGGGRRRLGGHPFGRVLGGGPPPPGPPRGPPGPSGGPRPFRSFPPRPLRAAGGPRPPARGQDF